MISKQAISPAEVICECHENLLLLSASLQSLPGPPIGEKGGGANNISWIIVWSSLHTTTYQLWIYVAGVWATRVLVRARLCLLFLWRQLRCHFDFKFSWVTRGYRLDNWIPSYGAEDWLPSAVLFSDLCLRLSLRPLSMPPKRPQGTNELINITN